MKGQLGLVTAGVRDVVLDAVRCCVRVLGELRYMKIVRELV